VAEVVVRAATAADVEAIMDLWRELNRHQAPWRVFPPRSRMEQEMRRLYERGLGDPRASVLVAEAGGRVVGTAFAHLIVPSSFSDEPAVELSGVVVSPEHRDRGVGTALAAEVGRFAERQGVRQVVIKTFARNTDALEFWRGLGFEARMVQMVADPAELGRSDTGKT
jgi:ribosomal protein S18 acetylase RimI-like enzyme